MTEVNFNKPKKQQEKKEDKKKEEPPVNKPKTTLKDEKPKAVTAAKIEPQAQEIKQEIDNI